MKLFTDFKEWRFEDPPSYAELPIDDNPEYMVPVAVKNAVFSKVPPEPMVGNTLLVCSSHDALTDLLELDPIVAESEEFLNFMNGKYLPNGSLTVSHRYGGYQFGYWADQLGDGRAHILGEYKNSKGELWQVQLKGSGLTPYSRFGDGRAVLRSSIREMIGSEAAYYLGIPTTRAAAIVVSDEHKVLRDKSYCGRMRPERTAIVARLAPAWYRLGSFEILHKRKEPELMKKLMDHIIKHHFPEIDALDEGDKYVKFFSEVAHRNLDMVATWQGFGFVHGVLNTDNISVFGLTIDYGPYGFMDRFSTYYVPNTSDDLGRYAYNKQPDIVLWNLGKFFEAISPILTEDQIQRINEIQSTLKEYVTTKILKTHLMKFGLSEVREGDDKFVEEFHSMLERTMADYTTTFRQLAEVEPSAMTDAAALDSKWSLKKLPESSNWTEWVKKYTARLEEEHVTEEIRIKRMSKVNPVYVPRNWMMQEAITEADELSFTKVRFLMELLKKPYEVNEEAEKLGYSSEPPSWSYGIKISCSS
ncbi:hypothetical protein O3G_MSEX002685 [Manduca sexta]|uniref:Selenoprotein O n=1 Tax=Manduca sexta TaxID=7130 RepID=A0A922CEC0_MANSE|nr:hypothetical protein O3G_MSEX002685 [Manduca sexta]